MTMEYEQIHPPKLVEGGVKYFLNETLKQCHIFKEKFPFLGNDIVTKFRNNIQLSIGAFY